VGSDSHHISVRTPFVAHNIVFIRKIENIVRENGGYSKESREERR